jgi:hypothetical protein
LSHHPQRRLKKPLDGVLIPRPIVRSELRCVLREQFNDEPASVRARLACDETKELPNFLKK